MFWPQGATFLAEAKHTFLYSLPQGGHSRFCQGRLSGAGRPYRLAVDDTKSVARTPAILRTVYIALAGIAASAAAVVICFAGVL